MSLDSAHIVQALSAAGIPKRYHRRSLSDAGERGVQLKQWVDTESSLEVKAGKGRFFVGTNPAAMDLFYLTARGLVLRRNSLWVVPLPVLARNVWEPDFRDRVEESDVLCVPGFYDVHYKQPVTEEVANSVEWFLRRRLMNEQAMLLQASSPVLACKWYSPGFLQLIAESIGGIVHVE